MVVFMLLTLILGCEMGAPVVDLRAGHGSVGVSCSANPMSCQGPVPSAESRFGTAPNWDRLTCLDGPLADPEQRVALSVELGELVFPQGTNCLRNMLDLRGSAIDDVALPALRLEGGELAILADAPVLLHGSLSVNNTRVLLDGPITLRIESGATWGYSALVAADASASASFTDSSIRNLAVQGPDDNRPFPGQLSVFVSKVTELFAWVDGLTLERVNLKASRLIAARFHMLDSAADDVQMELGDGDILSATLKAAALLSCDSLLMAGVKCTSCQLQGCSRGPLRIDSSVIEASSLVGDLSLQGTTSYSCKFGDGAESRLLAHGGMFTTPLFCDDMASIRLVGATATCADCAAVDLSDSAQYCQYEPTGGFPKSDGEPLPIFGEGQSTPVDQQNPACPGIGALPACATAPIPNRPYWRFASFESAQ
jgi:hypothetical protein